MLHRLLSDLQPSFSNAFLWVLSSNLPAHAFYVAHGWQRTAASKRATAGEDSWTEIRYERQL